MDGSYPATYDKQESYIITKHLVVEIEKTIDPEFIDNALEKQLTAPIQYRDRDICARPGVRDRDTCGLTIMWERAGDDVHSYPNLAIGGGQMLF